MQAVVRIGASQYLITPGLELTVDKLAQSEGKLTLDQILLVLDGDQVQVGQPYVTGVNITASVLGQVKGDKIRTTKFKAKSRYDKTVGFRPQYTKIKIEDITQSGTTSAQSPSPTPKSKTKKVRETKT